MARVGSAWWAECDFERGSHVRVEWLTPSELRVFYFEKGRPESLNDIWLKNGHPADVRFTAKDVEEVIDLLVLAQRNLAQNG